MQAKMTDRARRAVRKYGERACRKAFEMFEEGYGAAGIAAEGPVEIRTTRQADAAIDAGRELEAIASGFIVDATITDDDLALWIPEDVQP